MKIVKRLLIFLLCIVMAGGILFLISIPRVNDHIANHDRACTGADAGTDEMY